MHASTLPIDPSLAFERVRQSIVAAIGTRFDRAIANRRANARAALEYAVLATAVTQRLPTDAAARQFALAPIDLQRKLVHQSLQAIAGVFGARSEVLVNAIAGKLAVLVLPDATDTTEQIDALVDHCRTLVVEIARDAYLHRGKLAVDGGDFVTMASDDLVSPRKRELASYVAFLQAAVDSTAQCGAISQTHADRIVRGIQERIFDLRPPAKLHFSDQFLDFYGNHSLSLRSEMLAHVAQIVGSQAFSEIVGKLNAIRPPAPQRTGESRWQKSFAIADAQLGSLAQHHDDVEQPPQQPFNPTF